MKTKITHHLLALLLGVALTTQLHAQTSAFTYQGQLSDNGSPANGFYDLMFSVWNSASGPSQVGPTLVSNAVPVSDGLFTVRSTLARTLGVSAGQVYLAKHRVGRLLKKEIRMLERIES